MRTKEEGRSILTSKYKMMMLLKFGKTTRELSGEQRRTLKFMNDHIREDDGFEELDVLQFCFHAKVKVARYRELKSRKEQELNKKKQRP